MIIVMILLVHITVGYLVKDQATNEYTDLKYCVHNILHQLKKNLQQLFIYSRLLKLRLIHFTFEVPLFLFLTIVISVK